MNYILYFCAKLETMTELLSILYKLRIFTLDELSEALKGKVKSVEALLARYKQQGWIVAIRRNTYCMKDIASGLPVCDKYEIGSHLSPTACISYHTGWHQDRNQLFRPLPYPACYRDSCVHSVSERCEGTFSFTCRIVCHQDKRLDR